MKTIIALISLYALTGCASLNQAVSAAGASAIVSIRAAEDNNIKLWSANACGTPLSAAIRNPDIIPALKALCVPSGQDSSPISLLNAAQNK